MIIKAIKVFGVAELAISAVGLLIDTSVNLIDAVFGSDDSDKKDEENRG